MILGGDDLPPSLSHSFIFIVGWDVAGTSSLNKFQSVLAHVISCFFPSLIFLDEKFETERIEDRVVRTSFC